MKRDDRSGCEPWAAVLGVVGALVVMAVLAVLPLMGGCTQFGSNGLWPY